MAGPSSKGYSPIPVEERISNEIDERPIDGNASDDDEADHYTSNDPLLSRSQRETVSLTDNRRLIWTRVKDFNPFQAAVFHPSRWGLPPVKPGKQNIILKWIVAVMSIIILGLVIAVAVLGRLQATRRNNPPCSPWWPSQNSHIPHYNGSFHSWNFYLNFTEVYPPLSKAADPACKEAWENLRITPCHEKIWNRAWDDGKHSLFDPEIGLYAASMCRESCQVSLKQAHQLIVSECSSQDVFDMSQYVGPFTADPGLEEGPVPVLETLLRRLDHTCRQSPFSRDRYWGGYNRNGEYCVADIYYDWFIVDGMNAGNLEGLDIFETITSIQKEHLPPDYSYYRDSFRDADNADYYYHVPKYNRRVGPGTNQTTCGWCLLNWFERKMLSWKKDAIIDPKDASSAVDLPTYLHKIERLGSRCETQDWDRIYGKTIRHYKDLGLLPPDWEDKNDGKKINSQELDAFGQPAQIF